MTEPILEIFVETLFVIPGAFIRWMFTGFAGSFQETLETTNWIGNSILGGTVIEIAMIII